MSDNIAADELRLLVERIERLQEEKKGIADDIRDVFGGAKSRGFDTKGVRALIKLRALERHERQEQDAIIDTYRAALDV